MSTVEPVAVEPSDETSEAENRFPENIDRLERRMEILFAVVVIQIFLFSLPLIWALAAILSAAINGEEVPSWAGPMATAGGATSTFVIAFLVFFSDYRERMYRHRRL